MLRVDVDGRGPVGNGGVELPLLLPHQAAVVPKHHVLGIELESLVEVGNRFGKLALLKVAHAAHAKRLAVLGAQL